MEDYYVQLNSSPDITLPFFAYGIFKPRQIAYSRIEPYIKKPVVKEAIRHDLYLRDGIPFIKQDVTKYLSTRGYLFEFNNETDAKKAYGKIGKTISQKLYIWGVIPIAGKPANVLFGRKPSKSNPIRLSYSYEGANDPYFNEVLELIYDETKDKSTIKDIYDYFDVLKNYILLWAAIERYTSLRYGKSQSIDSNNNNLANEKIFQESLKSTIGDKRRTVFRTDTLEPHYLKVEDPKESISYYYTIRCNIIHRGKCIGDKDQIVLDSLHELIQIFWNVVDDNFK